jgi:hypothetical protein
MPWYECRSMRSYPCYGFVVSITFPESYIILFLQCIAGTSDTHMSDRNTTMIDHSSYLLKQVFCKIGWIIRRLSGLSLHWKFFVIIIFWCVLIMNQLLKMTAHRIFLIELINYSETIFQLRFQWWIWNTYVEIQFCYLKTLILLDQNPILL